MLKLSFNVYFEKVPFEALSEKAKAKQSKYSKATKAQTSKAKVRNTKYMYCNLTVHE